MRTFPFVTLDVFSDRRFGGNPLAVFPEASGLSANEMQALAAEMNLSETIFIFPPARAGEAHPVRIFNRTTEMPFAGHPALGAAFVLAGDGRGDPEVVVLSAAAGHVEVVLQRDAAGALMGGIVHAPQPLSLGQTFSSAAIARCMALDPGEVISTRHPPTLASVGKAFVIAEVAAEALARAAPDLAALEAMRRGAPHLEELPVHLYARTGYGVRARMFAPLAGTPEDPATGSANAALAGLLLHHSAQVDELAFEVVQGVELGRPSFLQTRAWRACDGIRAEVGGRCVLVLTGEAFLEPRSPPEAAAGAAQV